MQIARNKPKKGYVWDYTTTLHNPIQAVIYDFQLSRAGQHAEDFLISWQGHLVCDDYSDYKACLKSDQVIDVGYMAHAHCNCSVKHRDQQRQQDSQPIMRQLYAWLKANQNKAPKSSPTAKAINYSLKRWQALIHYLDDGNIPIGSNWIEVRHEVA